MLPGWGNVREVGGAGRNVGSLLGWRKVKGCGEVWGEVKERCEGGVRKCVEVWKEVGR